MQNQILRTRYIERSQLLKLLRQLFGDEFLVEDRPDYYALTVPRRLTEDEVQSITKEPSMEALRRKIENLRYQTENAYGVHFVPHDKLLQLMPEDHVRRALEDSAMKRFIVDETTVAIVRGAYRIFAILVLIGQPESILIFIKDDGHRQLCLDDKLPFSLDRLQELLPDSITAKQFNEKQKEFTVPIFDKSSLPRDFKGEVTLPFVEDLHIGSGGFGNVYKIKIAPSHQLYDLSSDWFVRKEFRPDSTEDDFEKELHNLAMLRLLRHPNIVELLGVYTHRGLHNFLFPLANEGNLASLLQNEPSPYLQSKKDLLVALAGLGSAVCAMHEYSSDNLQAVGCHHDLKPSNVLVDKSKFILADFGLSRLKESPQTSETLSKDARGDYLAPECEDLEADCEKYTVHRSSDIWSFGCIAAELLTYMIKGPSGVKAFEEKRVFCVRGLVLHRFHCGRGRPSKATTDWMEGIKSECVGAERQLALLIDDMLSIQPENRPRAPAVQKMLCAIAIEAVVQPVDRLYLDVSRQSLSIQVFLERERFASWKWSCGLATTTKTWPASADQYEWLSYDSFQTVLNHLGQLHDVLRMIDADSRMSKSLLPFQLRKINDFLYQMLPRRIQNKARDLWEHNALQTMSDGLLEQMNHDQGSSVGSLAAIKRMRILVKERSAQSGSVFFDPDLLLDRKTSENFTTQILLEDGQSTKPVLVERKYVDMHITEDHKREELLNRLEDIAELINCADKHNGLRVLHCHGMYYDQAKSAFGLVYDFPDLRVPKTEVRNTTLLAALERKAGNQELPLLGDRFQLAHGLAATLFQYHSIGWLHKSISSKMVMFFHHEHTAWSTRMRDWYLRGFLHGRLVDESAITEGLTSDPETWDYQHPDYLQALKQGTWRYLSTFDYYSLGIVLLEIGLWQPLQDMTPKWKGTPEQTREKLLRSAVPKLGIRAGAIYRDVVISCLTGRFDEDQEPVSAALHLRFKSGVVDQLALCKA